MTNFTIKDVLRDIDNDSDKDEDDSGPIISIIRVSTQAYQDCNGCLIIKKTIRPMRRLSSKNTIHFLDDELYNSSPDDLLNYGMPDIGTLDDGLYQIHCYVDKSYYGDYDVEYSFSKYKIEDKNENT